MRAKPTFDHAAKPLAISGDTGVGRDRGHTFTAELIKNIGANSPDQITAPSLARDADMNICALEMVEQDASDNLPSRLDPDGLIWRAKPEAETPGNELRHPLVRDNHDTISATE